MAVTFTEMHKEAAREVAMRRATYSKLTRQGLLNPIIAERQIEVMEAISKHLAGLASLEEDETEPRLL